MKLSYKGSSNPEIQTKRRYDIDWLRIFATITIFFYHSARFFDPFSWHLKNVQSDLILAFFRIFPPISKLPLYNDLFFTVFEVFISTWIMPLFFIISGMSMYYSIGARTNKEFIGERFKRLIIPLIFGIFILSPPQIYIERFSHYNFFGTFCEFLPHYFDGFYGFGGNFAWMGVYLWYLLFLFLFSVVTLRLFRKFRDTNAREKISKLANFCSKPGVIFLLFFPLGLAELISPDILGMLGGWSLIVYFIIFIYGYLIALNSQFQRTIEQYRIIALIIAILTSILEIFSFYVFLDELIYGIFLVISAWCWLITILGFASKLLNKPHRNLEKINELTLPFYILHQTIIIIVGWFIISLNMISIFKYLLICLISLIIIIGFLLVIRKVNVLRFLFGMRLKDKLKTDESKNIKRIVSNRIE